MKIGLFSILIIFWQKSVKYYSIKFVTHTHLYIVSLIITQLFMHFDALDVSNVNLVAKISNLSVPGYSQVKASTFLINSPNPMLITLYFGYYSFA